MRQTVKTEANVNGVVIYESMFGNTRDIALAIAEGLASHLDVRAFEVGEAPHVFDHPDVIVIGGPTHAFSMSRSSTRESAKDETDEPLVSPTGIREWIASADLEDRQACATFDTKVPKPKLPGSAAASAARKLKKHHCSIVARPETFWVDDMTGPLLDGECERARRWGEELAAAVSARASAH
ncbi:MAG: flavodoxin [Acidimicrobiia bacterium]|nr:flavodoxin [Acidimicrobiia bacterium]